MSKGPIETMQELYGDGPSTSSETGRTAPFDLIQYLSDHNVQYNRIKNKNGITYYDLNRCLFNPDHQNGDAAIIQYTNGALGYKCFHDSCQDKTWEDARRVISGNDSLKKYSGDSVKSGEQNQNDNSNDIFDQIEGLNAASLMKIDFPEPTWAIPNILPEGITLFAGKPKAGKSVLALNISLGIAIGGKALGVDVEKGTVLYLPLEDSQRRLKERIGAMLPRDEFTGKIVSAPDNLHLFHKWPPMGDGGCRALDQFLESHQPVRMVIIDTLKKFKPALTVKDKNKTNYDIDYESIDRLRPIAEKYRTAFVIIHHARKQWADDPIDLISGTFGIVGAVDNTMVMYDRKGNRATLHIQGRDVDQEQYTIDYNPDIWTWHLTGKQSQVMNTENQQTVRDWMAEETTKSDPTTLGQITKGTGLKQPSVRTVLKSLEGQGIIFRGKRGQYYINPDQK